MFMSDVGLVGDGSEKHPRLRSEGGSDIDCIGHSSKRVSFKEQCIDDEFGCLLESIS